LNKKSLILNAFILTGASLLLRAAGMFFRIYLSNRIGAEGMGLYQLITSVYFLAIHLSSGGIGIAVTRMVAERPALYGKSARDVMRSALLFSLAASLLVMAILLVSADFIALHWLGDARAGLPLRILAPSLPFIAAAACFRGYLTARDRVLRTSVAQILEQIIRMAVTMALIPLLVPLGLAWGCGAIVIGTTVSEAASCLFLLAVSQMGTEKQKSSVRETGTLRELLYIGMPVTVRTCFRSVLSTMENAMIPKGLGKYGVSAQQSLAQYGMLKGMALPVLFFPSSFISSISSLLVSELASSPRSRRAGGAGGTGEAKGQDRAANELTRQVLRYALLFSFYVAALFLFFSGEIGMALYKEKAVGSMVRILAPLVPFMYLESIVDGMLTALDQQMSVMKYNMIDAVGRLFLVMLLLPRMGMNGFLLTMYASNLFTSLMCIIRLLRVTEIKLPLGEWLGKPLLSAAIGGFGARYLAISFLSSRLSPVLLLAAECGICGVLYGVCLLLQGAVSVREFIGPLRARLSRRKGKLVTIQR